MEGPKHLDITVDKDQYMKDVGRILKEIRPNWSDKNINIKVTRLMSYCVIVQKLRASRVTPS